MPLLRLTGRLLVSSPLLRDPNFDRAVVLILEHGDPGAVGVILNRPSELEVAEAVPPWAPHAADPPVVFRGGPVAPGSVIGLASSPVPGETVGWKPLFGLIGAVDLAVEPASIDVPIEAVRLFSGYAGWDPGQLEGEMAMGAWFVIDVRPGDILTPHPHDLWQAVLRRQPGTLAFVASFPPDPNLN